MEQNREARARADDSRPVGEIASNIVENVQDIVHLEARLAVAEVKEKARQSALALLLLSAAAGAGFLGAACLVTTCIVAMAIVLPLWLSALLTGILLLFGAGLAYLLGRLALEKVDLVPRRTLETLKEDLDWIKSHAKWK
jgi:uncharacterized membrane protein YqjE